MAKFSLVLFALTATCALTFGAKLQDLLHRSTRQAGTCGKPGVAMRSNLPLDQDGRIVGGVEARPGSHPWIVSLQSYGNHFCGATLISVGNQNQSDIVVTAAHCFLQRMQELTASAGSHNFDRPPRGETTVYVKRIFSHPQYDPDTNVNDIAILKLEMPIKFSSTIQPACLPQPGEVVPDKTQGTVAGWGRLQDGPYDTSRTLMQVGVPVVNSQTCVNQYRASNMLISPKEMICAGYSQGGKDSCQGDSGGPLVFSSGQGYVLQGVVSFGEGCALADKPGVYARVSNYLTWINQQIKALSSVSG